MKAKSPFTRLSVCLLLIPLFLEAQTKPDWPGGVDPDTLVLNTDTEPDLAASGFVELFNGLNLDDWSVKGGAMKFTVGEESIIGECVPGEPNGFLCTDQTYTDFIFTTEFRWQVPGNSGIMFRADTRKDENEQIRVFGYQAEMDPSDRAWTGGIYGEAMGGWKYPLTKVEHEAARTALAPPGSWNRLTICAKGNLMRTWINGVPCAFLENTERSEGFFGLQVHSGKEGTIEWRNIRVKELHPSSPWRDLFASGDFSQWTRIDGTPVAKGWKIEDGIVQRYGSGAGDIITKDPFHDFDLSFDWKIAKGGNSGVKYRTRGNLGLEYQILDDKLHPDREDPSHRAGSLYDLVPAPDGKSLNPPGKWNSSHVRVAGNRIQHWLNGKKVVDIEYGSEEWLERFAASKYSSHEGFGTWSGPILLQDHEAIVSFRNVRIQPLHY